MGIVQQLEDSGVGWHHMQSPAQPSPAHTTSLDSHHFRGIPVWVSPEDVFDNDDGLLDNIVDLCLDQLQQDIDAALSSPFKTDGTPPNGSHTSAHKVDIHLSGILFELQQHL